MEGESTERISDLVQMKTKEIAFLAGVAKRAYQSVLQTKEPVDLRTAPRVKLPSVLRVASFAFELPNPEGFQHDSPDLSDKALRFLGRRYRHVTFSGSNMADQIYAVVDDFIRHCKKLERKPHFVLFNELALSIDSRDDLEVELQALATKEGIYIIPGSYHCSDEYFNVTPIYGPSRSKSGHVVKQSSAQHVNEFIRTPDARKVQIFETDFGNIVVWICLDMYDPGLVLKFLSMTNRMSRLRNGREIPNREIHLVLIPSYSTDPYKNIEKCIQGLSVFSKTMIVSVNSLAAAADGQLPRLESSCYVAGEKVSKIDMPGMPQQESCQAALYEVPFEKILEAQAADYYTSGVFSSPFAAIIEGEFDLRDLKD